MLGLVHRWIGIESFWLIGLYGAPSVLGGVRIESSDYVPCRVADWRVVFQELTEINVGTEIREDAVWKLTPTDP